MPVAASGRWFDGRSARPHPVTVRLAERLEITGPGIQRDWNPCDLRAAEAQAPLLRLRNPGEPGEIEVADETFAAALATRCPDLHRRSEDRGGTVRLVLWSLAAGTTVLLAVLSSVLGLLVSYDLDVPTGPAIVLTAGALWLGSLCLGPRESLARRWLRRPHLAG